MFKNNLLSEEKKMLTYTTHKNQWRQSFLVHLLSASEQRFIHTDAIDTHTSIKRASNGDTHIYTYTVYAISIHIDTTIAYTCVKFDICRLIQWQWKL